MEAIEKGHKSMTNPPRAVALVGMTGSGKTLCAQHLAQRGFFQFRFGGIVTDEVTRRGWEITPENERVVREQFRSEEGMDAIAKRALPHLKTAMQMHSTIIIDGLYGWSEYRMLRPELGEDMVVVAVACPRHLRYQRLTSRVDRPLTPEQAEQRDHQEIEKLEKGGPIAIADYTLVNDRDTRTLLAELDSLLEQLGVTP